MSELASESNVTAALSMRSLRSIESSAPGTARRAALSSDLRRVR
jgi:hypothetical protein